jgi:3-hydroxybutyryl-CoA dehydratase
VSALGSSSARGGAIARDRAAGALATGGAGDGAGALDWSAPFEDLRAGQRMRTRGRTVTEADVVGFAALSGDWHPQHTDASWAADSQFGERIAHGMLILSYAVGLIPFDPGRVVALRRIADVVFKRPVKIGETISVDGRVAELSELDEQLGLVGCAWSVLNQDDALVCRARVDVLWRRSGEPAGRAAFAYGYPSGVFPC